MMDFAKEADSFAAFQAEALAFFNQSDPTTEAEWREAVAEVRRGAVDAPLPRVNADATGIGLEILQTEEAVARELRLDDQPALAA